MNKDFLTKPISLKDIKLPEINIKNIKNNKLFFICIFAMIFIIVMLVIGFFLINSSNLAKEEHEKVQRTYMALQNSQPKEVMQKEIEEMINETSVYEERIKPINNQMEFEEIKKDFKANAPIKWSNENAKGAIVATAKGTEEYDIYSLNIKSFSGTLRDIKDFLTYVENYEKVVRIETIRFSRNKVTGNLDGQVTLLFYFKKLGE